MSTSSTPCGRCGSPLWQGWCLRCVAAKSSQRDAAPAPSAMASLQPPLVPGLRMVKLLGMGGSAQVWLAEIDDAAGPRPPLAVKVVHDHCRHNSEVLARFEQEAEILLALDHPNILTLHDVGETSGGNFFLATPYINGCDLRTLLKAGKPPPERAVALFREVCLAVEHAHERQIIHRDLKPANILVGADGAVKVADFGLAKNRQNPSDHLQTKPLDVFGTPYYMAPEAVKDSSQADVRSDVYALGVLLYELLTGSIPQGHYTSLAKRSGLARAWDVTLQGALRDEPGQRTASVAALRQAVERLWAREKRRGVWGQKLPWIVGGLGIATALAVGLWLGKRPPTAPAPFVFPQPSTARPGSPWVNGSGLKFLPLSSRTCLMSTTEVRIADFVLYLNERDSLTPPWLSSYAPGATPALERLHRLTPGDWEVNDLSIRQAYEQVGNPQLPAFGVSLLEALRYATWLTWRERESGRIPPSHHYRLPTSDEWGAAGGYSAGAAGNFAGPEVVGPDWPSTRPMAPSADPFPRPAPVMSFAANSFGFHDMAGNVSEWVTRYRQIKRNDVLHPRSYALVVGGSWADLPESAARRDRASSPTIRMEREDVGFRLVLDMDLTTLLDPESAPATGLEPPSNNHGR